MRDRNNGSTVFNLHIVSSVHRVLIDLHTEISVFDEQVKWVPSLWGGSLAFTLKICMKHTGYYTRRVGTAKTKPLHWFGSCSFWTYVMNPFLKESNLLHKYPSIDSFVLGIPASKLFILLKRIFMKCHDWYVCALFWANCATSCVK